MTTHKRKNLSSILFSAFLAALLLVVPCKVRNAIESALEIPTTSVVNKSQTAHHSCCVERMDAVTSSSTSLTLPTFFPLETLETFAFDFKESEEPSSDFIVQNHVTTDAPLYILYQNYKVYL